MPKSFLPPGTRIVNSERIDLNTEERRELLEQKLTYHLDRFLNKYSPIRRSIIFYKEWRLKRKQNQFYCLIGQITLTHAGIGQDFKNTLLVDWGVPKKINHKKKTIIIDKLYGYRLPGIFLELLEERLIPEEKLDEYKNLCCDFKDLSQIRNNTLKAIYGFNQDTAEISRIHEKNHGKYDRSMSFEEKINSWMPKVVLSELQDLYNSLFILRQKLMSVRYFIDCDKSRLISELCSEIGKTYPAYAFKNPYWYRASLKKEKHSS